MADPSDGSLCPSCGEFIPAAAPRCSRCGFETRPAPAPVGPLPPGNPYGPTSGGAVFIRHPDADKPIWQDAAFRVMAYVVLIDGILELVSGIITLIVAKGSDNGGPLVGHGALVTLVGVGLLAEWPWASLAIKICCWVNLVVAVGMLLVGGVVARAFPLLGVLVILLTLAFGAAYGFMLYLVNTVGLD
ncbi:MAG TPA: hypothetical protein VKT78_17985 [Fimbriimonadaceae bacterium]|nr:hypothetical protein [Fimbriimonadaceae bacterium]